MPFDNSRDEDLGVAAGAAPFAKLLPDAPVADEVLRVLIDGRVLIADPNDWLQGPATRARADGSACRCSFAALRKASGIEYGDEFSDKFYRALCVGVPKGFLSAIDFNDHPRTTHADMLGMWDRAIAARRAELVS